jgi:hypothetical protein
MKRKIDLFVKKEKVDEFIEILDKQDVNYTIVNGKEYWEGNVDKASFVFGSIIDKNKALSIKL